ncbi:hypothetical protein SAMN04487993_10281, partial [Salipiger marinus]
MTDRRDDVRARFAAAEDVDLPEGVAAEAQEDPKGSAEEAETGGIKGGGKKGRALTPAQQ